MASSPMYFPPAPFDLEQTVFCARLVETAYTMYSDWISAGKPDEHHFNWTPVGPKLNYSVPIWGAETDFWIFTTREPFAFVAWDELGTVYLAIRGTESVTDWIDDAEADQVSYSPVAGYGKVHQGFMDLYATMSGAIALALSKVPRAKQLFVTGHSLGCGLSTLAVPDIVANNGYAVGEVSVMHYNFASPRVGDPAFAEAYNANGVPTYRIVNTSDLVPEVPTAVLVDWLYQHVATEVSFTAQYGSLVGNHSLSGAYQYAINHPDQPQGPLG